MSNPVLRYGCTPLAVAAVCLLAACGRSGPLPVRSAASGGAAFQVVAAENFWGSLAAQLAGNRASVQSIIVSPGSDPHGYQPSAGDARAIAAANVVLVNGVGYDSWAHQLLQASPSSARAVIDVGALLHLAPGANPHRWYFPADVRAVVNRIAADYERIDPADASYFAQRRRWLLGDGFARYDELRREIRAGYAGVTVGYSESIFEGLGEDLGLALRTPRSFAKAIAEGTDVTAADRSTVEQQVRDHGIAVWVFNSQNVTPDVERVNQLARDAHVPVASVTETLTPPSASFEQWQVAQLEGLRSALRRATGRTR